MYSALLGYLVADASAGATHDPPHHVKVVSDDYVQTPDNNCGSKQRHIRLRPVDSSGRYAGQIRVWETLETIDGAGLQSLYNGCNGQTFYPIGCDPINPIQRSFTDQLWVGCPSIGGDCGFLTPNNGPFFVSILLTSNAYYITHSHVAANGNESRYSPGTHLY